MNAKILSLGLAGLVAVASIAACGDEPSDPQPQQAPSICDSVVCGDAEGVSCDPADGICKCGGAACSVGQRCEAGSCVSNPCAGVNCGPNQVCSEADGLCHCGAAIGQICAAGQACADDGTGTLECRGSQLCADAATRCRGGTTCDPADGECRCGGVGPSAPICGANQTCDVDARTCLGGNRCAGVSCAEFPGTSCDPEDGICKCGGLGGTPCTAGQVCRTQASTAACFDSCNPVASPTGCAGETACYFDSSSNLSLCIEPGTQAIDGTCTESSDCGPGLHCTTSAAEPRCRPYCRVPATGETDTCSGDPICLQIDGAPAGIGLCRTVN